MKNRANRFSIAVCTFLVLINLHTTAQSRSDSITKGNFIFPRGESAGGNYFTGNVWLKVLVENDSVFNYQIASVTFEPGARTHWHTHPGGQILLVTNGVGHYQEKGKPVQLLKAGDVVKCPADVMHWHGASPKSEMTHIGIANNTARGRVVWLQKVSDEEYNSLK